MIVIIDYGMGNLRSVYNKFKRMGINCIISSKKEDIESAEKLILPGVGHFKYGMQNLQSFGLIDILIKKVIDEKTPILGICLGTQLFCRHSQEGNCEGLGWLDAEVVKFNVSDRLKYKVPHMGWNQVRHSGQLPIFRDIPDGANFYFVHSYVAHPEDESIIASRTDYGAPFCSAVQRGLLVATQIYPEKSGILGLQLYRNFLEMAAA